MQKLKDEYGADYNEKVSESEAQMLLIFKIIVRKYFPTVNPYYLEFDESKPDMHEALEVSSTDWTNLKKNIRTKKEKPTTKAELARHLITMGKGIFGDVYQYKKKSVRIDGKPVNIGSYTTKICEISSIINLVKVAREDETEYDADVWKSYINDGAFDQWVKQCKVGAV